MEVVAVEMTRLQDWEGSLEGLMASNVRAFGAYLPNTEILSAMMVVVDRAGRAWLAPIEADNQAMMIEISRAVAAKIQARMAIIVVEAWMSFLDPDTEVAQQVLSGALRVGDLPEESRKDILLVYAEGEDGKVILQHYAVTARRELGERYGASGDTATAWYPVLACNQDWPRATIAELKQPYMSER